MTRLLVVGDIAWDILIRPDDEIVWGSDVFGSVGFLPGGSAANLAVWARRLGAEVRLRGKIGDDPLGVLMRTHLLREGVGNSLLIAAGAQTTRVGVLVSQRGERAFVTDRTTFLPFVDGELDPRDLERSDLLFLNGYGIFASGTTGPVLGLLAAARERRIPVAFDPSSFELIEAYGARRLLNEIGPIDILLVNEEEARVLQPGETVQSLLASVTLVVLKRGKAGAQAISAGRTLSADPAPASVIDTTGAGDAFDAAFLVEYSRNRDVAAALIEANRLGAYVASQLGAQPPVPDFVRA